MSTTGSSRSAIVIVLVALLLGCAGRTPSPALCALAGAAAGAAVGAGAQAGRDESGGDIAAGAAVGAAGAALIGYVVCRFVGEDEAEPVAEAPAEPEPVPEPERVRERIVLRGVTFGFDETEIDAADAVVLDEAVRQLQRLPELAVRIEGHTDTTGPAEYNQNLSERRAEAVRRYLEQNGIPAARLSAVGMGETQPIASNESPEGRARNRRVELQVIEP